MADVRLVDIEKKYGNFLAVPKQSLTIHDGEFLVLLGPSGCGKTTTMRMIAGLEDITSGDIMIKGERINDKPPKDRDIAMVFQNYGLYPHMTVRQNIEYPLKLRGVSKAERKTRVQETADKVELGALLDRRPSELSGGQRQRVALARAIVRTPKIFLMDEPLSNLDAKLRVSMRAELKHLHHELGVTTVYVTHDQMEAMTLATRVAVMREGRIVQLDTPKKIYAEPADLFVAGFIGSPSMNLIDGAVKDGVFHADGVTLPVNISDRDGVVLGIRPEELDITQDTDAPIGGKLYALELTGESTLVTLRNGPVTACARGHADFEAEINSSCYLAPKPGSRFHLFDRATGERLDG
ncbi:carbohydrate ABC transporter ATP-binding protein, CUT1 family [Cognatiyoonia koreensis]|uniref:Carbohydrate ABC transporter ATP-binding protein, CUT1 family n=1 Tax=Cognatiyoonia koreensis TaxID=364200 RepID=A0A1I0QGM5_9RHOB|nr:sn-glycerol-3-phosphate ABC transporter ATP-binding protein UgpC [Cognatiyoonia koreensis]SEW26276.1 carbohydrate ABC transporter ATP-binding protein, CUT1 family [Cognatiyoonia koreensis]